MANPSQKAEEAKLDHTLEGMIQKVNDIKSSINQFLWKLDHEHETLTWPSVLDSFAVLSSQINSFQKLLADSRSSQLKNYVFVPLQLNPARDIDVERLTEGRVPYFNHEVVPHYLRSKPELDVEKKMKSCSEKSSTIQHEAALKQIASFNRICTSVSSTVQSKRDEWRSDDSSRRLPETSNRSHTETLVAAVTHGKGLIDHRMPQPMMHPNRPDMAAGNPPPHVMMHPRAPTPTINIGSGGGRMPSVRPNIRMQPYPSYRP